MNRSTETGHSQTTDTVLMIRPAAFGFNEETAVNNAFQHEWPDDNIAAVALIETDKYIQLLRKNGIKVVVVDDTEEPRTPDAVFPNNWFSTHENGTLVLYPMFARNRRLERKIPVLEAIWKNFKVKRTLDLTHYEAEGQYLEGTGSMVLDRVNKIVYACRSPRTSMTVLDEFCRELGYTAVAFEAADEEGRQIYHTNVMMHVGTDIAVVCMESITDPAERSAVRNSLEKTGKTILEITFEQMDHFAGNMLELHNSDGQAFLVMSKTARSSLTAEQLDLLKSAGNTGDGSVSSGPASPLKLITPSLDCIEQNGGGSARCILAEIF